MFSQNEEMGCWSMMRSIISLNHRADLWRLIFSQYLQNKLQGSVCKHYCDPNPAGLSLQTLL